MNENVPINKHLGTICNGYKRRNFSGRRFRCLSCDSFNLCARCYHKDYTTNEHVFDHPVICLYTPATLDLFFGGETFQNAQLPQSFRCPYCKKLGYDLEQLELHCDQMHVHEVDAKLIPTLRANV